MVVACRVRVWIDARGVWAKEGAVGLVEDSIVAGNKEGNFIIDGDAGKVVLEGNEEVFEGEVTGRARCTRTRVARVVVTVGSIYAYRRSDILVNPQTWCGLRRARPGCYYRGAPCW